MGAQACSIFTASFDAGIGSRDMARSRTSVLVMLLVAGAVAALFTGGCSFVGPARELREVDVRRGFFGAPEPEAAPAPAPPPPAPVASEGGNDADFKAVLLGLFLTAFVVFPKVKFPES